MLAKLENWLKKKKSEKIARSGKRKILAEQGPYF